MFIAARTDAGLVRETNQDRYLVWNLGVDGGDRAGQFVFCAVADGMGGSAAGDRASALALSTLADKLLPILVARCGEANLSPCDVPRLLTDGTKWANTAILEAAAADDALQGMGTTLTAGLLSRGVLYLAQVGDSRCYRLRSGVLEQQTSDHSLVGELVRMGKLTSDQARQHPRRHIITRALGVQDDLEPDVTCQAVEVGDIFLFCSDGLWELVPDSRMQQILSELNASEENGDDAALTQACDRLLRAALQEGGEDNITALLAAVQAKDIHPEAHEDSRAFARTRIESAVGNQADLKKTLRYRFQAMQERG